MGIPVRAKEDGVAGKGDAVARRRKGQEFEIESEQEFNPKWMVRLDGENPPPAPEKADTKPKPFALGEATKDTPGVKAHHVGQRGR